MNIWEEIKKTFRQANNLTRLIYINLAVFVVIKLISLAFFLFDQRESIDVLVRWLSIPANPIALLHRPWTLLTYMFLHENFLHILFNMLWLFWFGKIFLEYLDQRRLLWVYLLGGLAGAFLYVLAYNIFPVFEKVNAEAVALGASAAVYAIVFAISSYVPNHTVYVMFLGPVKIKYIALFVIVIDILSIPSSNAGGHIAHLGGAMYGYLFAVQYRRGKDIVLFFNRFFSWLGRLFKPTKRIKVTYRKDEPDREYLKRKVDEQKEIDRILDKIAKGGYECLTKEEKATLFNASRKS
jgi:membrane associated rhomboid family serine protease